LTFDNSQVSSSNPTGNVSEDIDETYPPFGEQGVSGEVREYEDADGIVIAYFEWDSFSQVWNEVIQ